MTTEIKTIQYDFGNYDVASETLSGGYSYPETIFEYDDSAATYTDRTTLWTSTSSFSLIGDLNDAIFLGHYVPFNQLSLRMSSAATGGTRAAQYWNGSTWTTLPERILITGSINLTSNNNNASYFNIPLDWTPTSVNGVTKYWIRYIVTGAYTSGGTGVGPFRIKPQPNDATTMCHFNKVFRAQAGDINFVDVTNDAFNGNGSATLTLNTGINDLVYFGSKTLFHAIGIRQGATSSSGGKTFEYWNGSTWATITTEFTAGSTTLSSTNTNNVLAWDIPSDWVTTTVNGVSDLYWIRLRNTASVGAGSIDYVSCGKIVTLPVKTVYIPENSNRTIHNAYIKINFKTSDDTTDLSYFKLDMKAGAGNWTPVFTMSTAFDDSGEHTSLFLTIPITSFLNSNFGSGTSQTIQLRFSSMAEEKPYSSITNISCEMFITYEADLQNTRIKTIKIPIHSNTIVNGDIPQYWQPVGEFEIPALNTILPESSKTYRDIYTVLYSNENCATNPCPYSFDIDLGGNIKYGSLENNSGQSGTSLFYTHNWTNLIDLNQQSYINARILDANSSNKFTGLGGYIVVTYEYDESTSNTIFNSVDIPFNFDTQAIQGTNRTTDSETTFEYLCNETNPVLKQSGAVFRYSNVGSTTMWVGSQINSSILFDYFFVDDGGVFEDYSTNIQNTVAASISFNSGDNGSAGDKFYIGSDSPWSKMSIVNTGTTSSLLYWEYWNGSSWDGLYSYFDSVFSYDDSLASFTSLTAAAADYTTAGGVTFNPSFSQANDILYLGSNSKFTCFTINYYGGTTRSGGSILWEYWNGSSWSDATNYMTFIGGTSALTSSEIVVRIALPVDWQTTTVNSESRYWLRARQLTNSTTAGTASHIVILDKMVPNVTGMFNATPANFFFTLEDTFTWNKTTVNGVNAYWIRATHVTSRSGTTTINGIHKSSYILYSSNVDFGYRNFVENAGLSSVLNYGYNYITVRASTTTNTAYFLNGFYILNYTSDKMTDSSNHNKTVCFCGDFAIPGNIRKTDTFAPSKTESEYYINNFGGEINGFSSASITTLTPMVEPLESEISQNERARSTNLLLGKTGFFVSGETNNMQNFYNDINFIVKKFPNSQRGIIDLFSSRKYNVDTVSTTLRLNHIFMATYNKIYNTYTVRVLGYSGDGSGISVDIFNQYDQLLLTLTTTTGGIATFNWYFESDQLYAKANQGNQFGVSKMTTLSEEDIKVQFKKPFGSISS